MILPSDSFLKIKGSIFVIVLKPGYLLTLNNQYVVVGNVSLNAFGSRTILFDHLLFRNVFMLSTNL